MFIQEFADDDGEGAQRREQRQRSAQPEVQARGEAIPTEDVDRHEDRLEKEGEPLDREGEPEHVAEATEHAGPEDPELEREHGAGHRADGEGHPHRVRPAARQPQRRLVVVAEPVGVGDQREQRQADAERHQQDVEPEREGHLAPRRDQIARADQNARLHPLAWNSPPSTASPPVTRQHGQQSRGDGYGEG